MPSQDITVAMLQRMAENCPRSLLENLDFYRVGIGCVINYLSAAGRPVSAGEISRHMHVSTARVAVLLRKMDERDLIRRERDLHDARRTLICLSPTGEVLCRSIQQNFIDQMAALIDQVGVEKIEQFISISTEISRAMETQCPLAVPKALSIQ